MKIKDLCFEIIQKCPNNCMFCSSESNYNKHHIVDFETFKKTINHLISLGGVEEISFSGGEPMLHPNIYEMVEYCSKRGMKTTLYTSGIVPREKRYHSDNPHIQKMIDVVGDFRGISAEEFKKLEECGLNKVVFDVQAAEVDEYSLLMGTKNNLSWLVQSLLHASYCDIEKSVHLIPNKINIHQLKGVMELVELAGIEELRVLKFVPQGRGRQYVKSLQLSNEELMKFVENAESLKSDVTKIKIGIPLMGKNEHICTAGYDKVVIRYDGQILPCPAFKDVDLKALEARGFKSVNIFENLEDFTIEENSHKIPLCTQMRRHEEREL